MVYSEHAVQCLLLLAAVLFMHTQQEGFTPLIMAAQKGHTEIARTLIHHKASANHQEKVHGSSEDMIQFVYVHCSFQDGWCALHLACAYGHPSLVDLLLKSGSLVDLQTKVQWML